MQEGLDFLIPSRLSLEGRTYRQPEVVFISLPQASTGLRYACRARSVGGHFMQTCSCRRRHSYAEGVFANTLLNMGNCICKNDAPDMAEKGEKHDGNISSYDKNYWKK